jgi:galactokinase
VKIDLPDIGGNEEFGIGAEELAYQSENDYFRSSYNLLLREGLTFSSGMDCVLTGNIPVNAGTSSSSALVVAWIDFLARMSDQAAVLERERLAELAYAAEVGEFGEAGGMMDQYTISLGGTITLASYPEMYVEMIGSDFGAFVLGDSGQPKDTQGILGRVRGGVEGIVRKIREAYPGFSLHEARFDELREYNDLLDGPQRGLLMATVRNRDITREALDLLAQKPLDHARLGRMLTEHHAILRDILGISTPKIDSMVRAALDAGALGGKINGSGGGGCMFAYAPENPEEVLEAARKFGDAWIVRIDEGARMDEI